MFSFLMKHPHLQCLSLPEYFLKDSEYGARKIVYQVGYLLCTWPTQIQYLVVHIIPKSCQVWSLSAKPRVIPGHCQYLCDPKIKPKKFQNRTQYTPADAA